MRGLVFAMALLASSSFVLADYTTCNQIGHQIYCNTIKTYTPPPVVVQNTNRCKFNIFAGGVVCGCYFNLLAGGMICDTPDQQRPYPLKPVDQQ